MNKNYISLSEPIIFGNEIANIKKAIIQNDLVTGDFIEKFEKKIKNYLSIKYSLACINGTAALHIALKVLGINKNEEVIVPTLTFIATINSVIYNQAYPIFMDSDHSFNIDQNKILKFINENTYFKNNKTYNKKTKRRIFAIIITHVWGNAANLEKVLILCKKKNIKVVEDATESLGSKYIKGRLKNNFTGTVGDIGCISFNGNKIITSAGGGMILTNNKNYYEKAKLYINQYKTDSIFFKHDAVGYNYRISNLQSALGFSQLTNLNKVLKLKKNIHHTYKKYINNIRGLELLTTSNYSLNNNWMNILLLKNYPLSRNQLISVFKKNKVEVRPVWHLNHDQKMFKKYEKFEISKSRELVKNSICLPSSSSLTLQNINRIINILKNNA